MITMTLKVNKKRIKSCEYKSYTGFKDLFEFIIERKGGFKSQGRGVFTKEEYPTSDMFRNIIPVMMEFEQTYDDMIDDIYQWTYHDSKHECLNVLAWYNKHRRKFFEEEVLPKIHAYRKAIANQRMAKLMMQSKQDQKSITKTTAPPPQATNFDEIQFDEEVPF